MTLGRFQNNTQSDLLAALQKPPIKASDVRLVRNNYGISPDFNVFDQNKAKKGRQVRSDTNIYNHSVNFVLAWWKKNHPAPAPKGGGSGSGGGGGTGMSPRTGGASSPSGGLAPVAASPPAATSSIKADTRLNPPSSYMAPGAGTNRTLSSAGRDQIANTVPVSSALAYQTMTQMGLRGVTPPASALVSMTALRAWISQQLAKQTTTTITSGQSSRYAGKTVPL